MFVLVRKEAVDMMSSLLAESYRPSCACIGRVASVLAGLLLAAEFVAHIIWTALLYKYCISNS